MPLEDTIRQIRNCNKSNKSSDQKLTDILGLYGGTPIPALVVIIVVIIKRISEQIVCVSVCITHTLGRVQPVWRL